MKDGLINNGIDQIEFLATKAVAENPEKFQYVNCPVTHRFTPGLYIREIFMPAGENGTVVTSLVHNTTHPFFVLQGKVTVISENGGEQEIEAPYSGITTPGTRRFLYVQEDCIWVTVHQTEIKPLDDTPEEIEKAVQLICDQILLKYDNPLLDGHLVNNKLVPAKELKNS